MRFRTIIAFGVTVIVILTATVSFWQNRPSRFVPTPLPVPNGYDDLMRAGELIQKETGDFNKMSEVELRKSVEGNSNALQIARLGLNKKIQVPVTNSIAFLTATTPKLVRLRSVARGFTAESRLAEMEHHTNDGVRSALDAIRLGIKYPRGGILVDGIMGIAIESLGTDWLKHFTSTLDAKSCREIARELEYLDAERQSWEELLNQEHYWSRQASPSFNYTIANLFMFRQTRAIEAKSKQQFIAQEIKIRKVIIELAARAYELDKGRRPNSTRDLAPEYLKMVPQDPSTRTNLTYLP
jgi:hypothetical protein